MSLSSLFSRAARERFVATVRNEGWRAAATRTQNYVGRVFRGAVSRSAVPDGGGGYLNTFWRDMAQKGAFHVSHAPATLRARPRIAMIGDLYLPQCRKYRVAQLTELWGSVDVHYDFSHYADVPRAISLMQTATHVMFYRTQNDARMMSYIYEARRLQLPILYDLDDPLFSISAYESYENMKALEPGLKAQFLGEAPLYLGAMTLADIVTVSTPGMAEHTRLYTPRPVYVRRNFADWETLDASNTALAATGGRKDGPFRVAFASGSMGHEVDFGLIADDLAAFLDADPNRQLVIQGHFDLKLLPQSLRDRVEMHKFRDYNRYLETLATVHCALMPLTDDPFNRCKSAVRVIDAASVAVPSIVGRVSDMAAMVQDGVTGRILDQGSGWRAALEEMAADRAMTAAWGQAARTELLANWTAQPRWPVVEPDLIAWAKG
ncbi:MAG: hypothetical protein AAF672_04645 [Pseudomonadota bacterium]